MSPEQLISQFIKKDQRILQIGGNPELKELAEADTYTYLSVDEMKNIPSQPYDYAILTEVLELIDNPVELINTVKNLSRSVVIYEYKYDEIDVDPAWRKPWQSVGLEFSLTRGFDYVNSLFLGYATIHICEMPYTPTESEQKEHPDAIR